MKKRFLLIMGIVCISIQVFSQQRVINGKIVSGGDALPLAGVSVKVKGGSNGTTTNANGAYTISVSRGQVLIFSYVGFTMKEVLVGQQKVIDITLDSDAKNLSDVIVVGYGTQKRANLTGAVSTVDISKTLGTRPITDLARGLQGAVPGLTITTPSGELGKNPLIRLRGITGSLNSPNGAQPLVLVDNVEMQNLQMVNPEDIEAISVLKDAASTSIYGTRAAWGVILITTKSGKKGAPVAVSYTNNFGFGQPTTVPKIASASEGADMVLQALRRSGNNPGLQSFSVLGMSFDSIGNQKIRNWQNAYGGQDLGPEMVVGRDYEIRNGSLYFYRPWDPLKMYMRDWSPSMKHDISISGGSEKTTFNLGLGYLGQNGVLKVNPDQFDRYNGSLGVTSEVNKWLDVRAKLMTSSTLTTTPFIFSSTALGPWYYLLRWPAVYPYGTLDGKPFRSSITEVQQAQMNQDRNTLTRISAGATIKPLTGLSINLDYTYTGNNEHVQSVGGGASGIDFWAGQLNYLANYQSATYDKVTYISNWDALNTAKAYATYDLKLRDHRIKIIAGSDFDQYKSYGQYSERRNVIDPNFGQIALTTGDQYSYAASGFSNGNQWPITQWSTLGFFGRINYDYKNKFLLELNGRRDGSSRFPPKDAWAFFPSMSAGYVLTEEKFMESTQKYLSFFKLRGSWGILGNQGVGDYRFLSTMASTTSNWWIGSSNSVTFSTPQEVKSTLTWEKIGTLDFGVDSRFLNNKLGVTFDWYQRTTSDMIRPGVTLPSSYGGNTPVRNYGAMQTTGWELAVDFKQSFNDFQLNATVVLSDFKEKITKDANVTKGINDIYAGKTIGEIWGYESQGLFQTADFTGQDATGRWTPKGGIADQALLEGNSNWFKFGPGDVHYRDLNGDGKINPGTSTVDDHGDMKVIGNSTPRYQYGIRLGMNWKGFDFDMFWQGVGKRDVWPLGGGPVFIPGFSVAEAWYQHQTDYWTPTNPNAYYPRPTNNPVNAFNFYKQDRYLLNMAYIRLKNVQLGYSLPKRLVKAIHINNLRVYASGENLLTFDKLKLPIDPEVDYTVEQYANAGDAFGRVYPYRKVISFGIQVTF
jgi:TonB-linked SusC/RagA family outer membrane protein